MGAPKQKWTAAEEAALRAGIAKYGLGKWSTILKDPDFSTILQSRSNVDLKDKWRNINVMVNGNGSRQRGRNNACKNTPLIQKNGDNVTDARPAIDSNIEIYDIEPLDETPATLAITAPKRPISRLDNVILEAINELKEPRGSSSTAIAHYIKNRYSVPSNFGELLGANLKHMTEFGRLVKVKHQYKLAPSLKSYELMSKPVLPLLLEGAKDSPKADNSVRGILSNCQVDTELKVMRSMTIQEAAEAAARAIVEAELAETEAEKAAREAEEAEAEAEAAKCFAEAVRRALKPRNQRA